MSTTTLKRTPFYEFHKALGAKLVDFAGYEMPVRYTGDVREHRAVREAVGLFDVSHMGEFRVTGPGALAFVDRCVTNDVAGLEIGQVLYSPMCRPDGGIVDDLLVYRAPDHVMVVVNASNIAKDFAWMLQHLPPDAKLEDRSDETALLALQGPRAAELLRGHVPDAALDLGYYRFVTGTLFGADAILSRTGYTGEDGFELYFDVKDAARVWEGLMKVGTLHGLEPVGLGARDTLRLEMGYMLYGNDIDDSTNPLEAGIGWTVKLDRNDFIGRDALIRIKQEGLVRRLVGVTAEGRRVPRHGMVVEAGGRPVGQVTSGTFSPTLERAIAMAYVERGSAAIDTPLEVVSGTTRIPARITKKPFHPGSHR